MIAKARVGTQAANWKFRFIRNINSGSFVILSTKLPECFADWLRELEANRESLR